MGVKTVTRTVLVLAVVLCVSSCLVGRYMCNYSLLPAEHGNDLEGDRTKTESRYPGIIAWYETAIGCMRSLHRRAVRPKRRERPWWCMAIPITTSAS